MPYNANLQFEGIVEFSDGGFSFTHPPPTHAHTRTHTRMHAHMHTHTHTRTQARTLSVDNTGKERKKGKGCRKTENKRLKIFAIFKLL